MHEFILDLLLEIISKITAIIQKCTKMFLNNNKRNLEIFKNIFSLETSDTIYFRPCSGAVREGVMTHVPLSR